MARGKHAARSNVKRADAMAEHIDRLTEQLADAKLKARQYQLDAQALQPARVELAKLRQQLAESTSDEVERLRDTLDGERRDWAEKLVLFGRHFLDLENSMQLVVDELLQKAERGETLPKPPKASAPVAFRTYSAKADLRDLLGPDGWDAACASEGLSRDQRRIYSNRYDLVWADEMTDGGVKAHQHFASVRGGKPRKTR